VVSVAGLTAAAAAQAYPQTHVDFLAIIYGSRISGKRAIEEQIVASLLSSEAGETKQIVTEFRQQIKNAPWRFISATKANDLLKDKLFERVFAVRVTRFARNYPNAELDMHLSLSEDMTTLEAFLNLIRETGLHGVTAYLSRGRI
jgi:hypothetical protein